MDLVTGATASVISKLGELLNEEYKLHKGLPEKIRSVIKELECAHAALRKVAAVPPEQLEEQVRIWAREVREASYDMEDVLDNFLVSALQGDPKQMDHQSLFECLKNKMAGVYNMVVSGPLKRRKIAVTIDDINNRLQAVTERHRRYTVHNFMSKPSPTSTIDPRLEVMYKEVTELVGIEKPSTELISMLSLSQGDEASKKKIKTVSVVGTGGLGKTTLARAVYNKIKVEFTCWAFVLVGRHPNLKKVFRDILIELDKNFISSKMIILDERQLINMLREYLGNKRYFTIIDDIWETKSWEAIKLALVEDNCGSRLITTTRNLEVATQCGDVYKLQPLVYKKSRKLFYTRIFGAEGKCPDVQLDESSIKMLKKCNGIPLSIITMASLLVGKSREEWIKVCHSIVFRDKKKSQQLNDTEWILSLSYYDLPPHLKTCLLYLSAFPEDYTIEKISLIWKWVSEGFVKKVGGTGLFEVGEGYFNELINRSMIQPVQSETGLVYGCHVHDMLLDLLRLISHEENFITISNNDEGILSPCSRVRRLAHQNRILEPTHHIDQLGHLRSLITSSCYYKGLSLPSFKLLRILALENCKVMTGCIPLNHLESLVHLRYLGLRGMGISKLPEGIGALKFLQTLDLKDTSIKVLPASVGLLTRLICLRAEAVMVPNGVIEKLISLEELHILSAMQESVKELDKLMTELLALNKEQISGFSSEIVHADFVEFIRRDLNLRSIHDNAEKWGTGVLSRHLQRLYLHREALNILPACINPLDLPILTHLELNLRIIEGQHLQILGGLPELRHLKLNTDPMGENATKTKLTVASTTFDDCSFKRLRYCMFPNSFVQFVLNEDSSVSFTMWNGTADVAIGSKRRDECRVAPVVMPNLEELIFWVRVEHTVIDMNCSGDNLGLEYLPSLKKVRVLFMTHNSHPDGRKQVKVALTKAIQVHPKKPRMEFRYFSAPPAHVIV